MKLNIAATMHHFWSFQVGILILGSWLFSPIPNSGIGVVPIPGFLDHINSPCSAP